MPKIWLLSTARILCMKFRSFWMRSWGCSLLRFEVCGQTATRVECPILKMQLLWNLPGNLREDDLKQEIGKNVNQFFRSAPRSFRFHPTDTMCKWTSGLLVSEMSIVFLKYCFKSCVEPWGDSCYQTGCGFSNKHSEHVPSLTIPLSVHVPVYPERKMTFREKNTKQLFSETLDSKCLVDWALRSRQPSQLHRPWESLTWKWPGWVTTTPAGDAGSVFAFPSWSVALQIRSQRTGQRI